MIKFINNDGVIYDGSYPYIHWMDNEQSTLKYYVKRLFIISDIDKLTISLHSNIFGLIDIDKMTNSDSENINGFEYKDLINCAVEELVLNGNPYNQYYLYNIYIYANSTEAAEYVEDFYINDIQFRIGIDSYDCNEILQINASNMGINIPMQIQHAIYDSNVHDESIDNILINRKMKELLSNYWDMIANKGSYKSLLNSLKWFEWDNVELRELWEYDNNRYDDRPISDILDDKYKDTLSAFSKTTYYLLTCALKTIGDDVKYDNEKNPILYNIVRKWSIDDLLLKVTMLGNFYEEFFTPIHICLKLATIEDIIYTNTIKLINSPIISRSDVICRNLVANCKYNEIGYLTNVKVFVGNDTLFKTIITPTDSYDNIKIVGVDPSNSLAATENQIYPQLYTGIGYVAKFSVDIPLDKNDFIKSSEIYIKYPDNTWVNRMDSHIFYENDGFANITFNILLTSTGKHEFRMIFHANTDVTCNAYIDIIDDIHPTIKLHKLEYDFDNNIWPDGDVNDIIFRYIPQSNLYNRYISTDYTNNIIVFKIGTDYDINSNPITNNYYFNKHYIYFTKNTSVNNVPYNYIVCISKDLSKNIDKQTEDNYINNIIINPNISLYSKKTAFISEFYKSTLLDPPIIQDEMISISLNVNDEELLYIKYFDDIDWKIINKSTGDIYQYKNTINPIIEACPDGIIKKGYYDISINYKLGSDIKNVYIDGAFLKK